MIPVGILTAAATSSFSFLLDDYPNAAGAYSFRKLRSSYTGSCIRVRRAIDGLEMDIGFVNNVLDTTALLTFIGNITASGTISILYDQSGNSNNAIQTIAAQQPVIVSAGVLITLNSKPAFSFSGLNQQLFFNTGIVSNTNISIFFTGKGDSLINNGLIIGGNSSPTSFFGYFRNSIDPNIAYIGALNGTNNIVSSTGWATANYTIFNCIVNSSNYFMYKNNTISAITTAGISLGTNTFTKIGQYFTYDSACKITELIIYKSDQSSNRTGIVNNTNTFYTIF